MAAPAGIDLVLFVSGRLDPPSVPVDSGRRSVFRRLVAFFLPEGWALRQPPSSAAAPGRTDAPDPLPPRDSLSSTEHQCVALVLDLARREGRKTTVVSADEPGPYRYLLERWIGENDPLPLLVRSDGERLAGPEEFVPAEVRRFLRRE